MAIEVGGNKIQNWVNDTYEASIYFPENTLNAKIRKKD